MKEDAKKKNKIKKGRDDDRSKWLVSSDPYTAIFVISYAFFAKEILRMR